MYYFFHNYLFLQEAHKMLEFVLRHGNDLLAVERLKGFEVKQVSFFVLPFTTN